MATFIPEFVGVTDVTIAAAPALGVQIASKAGFRNNPKWAWSPTANKMDTTLKIFEGSLQYVAVELDANAARTFESKI